jgi:hypothetical protein
VAPQDGESGANAEKEGSGTMRTIELAPTALRVVGRPSVERLDAAVVDEAMHGGADAVWATLRRGGADVGTLILPPASAARLAGAVLDEAGALLGEPALALYGDQLDGEDQVDAEEQIAQLVASALEDDPSEPAVADETLQLIGRAALKAVLVRFRPDLFV